MVVRSAGGGDEKFGSRLDCFFLQRLIALWKCPHCAKSHHFCSAFPWHLADPSASVALSFLPASLPHRAIATSFAIRYSGCCLSLLKSLIPWYFTIWYSKRGDKVKEEVNFASIVPDFGRKGWWQKPRWKENVGPGGREKGKEKVIVTCHRSDR